MGSFSNNSSTNRPPGGFFFIVPCILELTLKENKIDFIHYGGGTTNSENDPLENILKEEKLQELVNSIKDCLSDAEYEVYSLMINGLKYDEIATLLNKNLKQVDNTIQRVRNKIKKILVNR